MSASTESPAIGSPLVLSASCTGAVASYEWLACAPLTPQACTPLPECATATTSCSPTASQPGPVVYALRATSASGATTRADVAITWQARSTPPSGFPPSCSLAASHEALVVGATLTLTATCSNAPTAYAWAGCASAGSVCTVSESTPGTRTYTVTASNAGGASVPRSVTVTWHPTPTATPSCTLSASPAQPYAGAVATITATCTQAPASLAWTGCASASGTTCVATSASAGPATYTVVPSNALGSGAPASITLNWQAPPPPGPSFCASYAKVKTVELPWGGIIGTNDPGGGLEHDAVLVARLRVPPEATATSSNGLIRVVEFVDGPAERVMTLSPSACDFRGFTPGTLPPTDADGGDAPMAWGFGINPAVSFALAGMPTGAPKLIPGQVYYVNLANRVQATGGPSCATDECNVRVNVSPPR